MPRSGAQHRGVKPLLQTDGDAGILVGSTAAVAGSGAHEVRPYIPSHRLHDGRSRHSAAGMMAFLPHSMKPSRKLCARGEARGSGHTR